MKVGSATKIQKWINKKTAKAKASAKESVEHLKDSHNMTADNRLFWSLPGEAGELSASSSGEEKPERRSASHVSVSFSVEVSGR